MKIVPVVDNSQNPLMPTTRARAERWVKSGKATYFWKKGMYCVRLNIEPSNRHTQPIVVGVDPGAKREGFTVKSASKTYLNIQTDARIEVKDKIELRRILRRGRRNRNTPYRQCRLNRSVLRTKNISPSTKSRWQWKLRVLNWLDKIFPITNVVVEDVKAQSKPSKRSWNESFSPIEIGKTWFYNEVKKFADLSTVPGHKTKELRDQYGLKKIHRKLADVFEAHCVDSWVLANSVVGGHTHPDNTRLMRATSFNFRRRSLHLTQYQKGGNRRRHGGTISLGFKRGSLVIHPKYGLSFVGGFQRCRVSLHSLKTGKRLTTSANPSELRVLSISSFRSYYTSM